MITMKIVSSFHHTWLYSFVASYLSVLGSCQLKSSTMKLVSDSSGALCADDRATTVTQARSLIDCQRQCSTQKSKCYAANFYSDTKTCELYNFTPTTFTSSRKSCTFLKYKDIWDDTVCMIESASWGGAAAYSGFVAINGNKVISSTISGYRGFNLVQLNVSSCSASNIVRYDTNGNTANSENMATYIISLPLNTVLIGITADDAQGSLTPNAKSALLAIGVNVTGLLFRGKVCFIAQVGQPAMTVSQVDPPGISNLMLTVDVIGYEGISEVTIIQHQQP